jgi:hypothetical protein
MLFGDERCENANHHRVYQIEHLDCFRMLVIRYMFLEDVIGRLIRFCLFLTEGLFLLFSFIHNFDILIR